MTLLQAALDFDDGKKALAAAKKICPYVDIIEIGTPLIKAEKEAETIRKMRRFRGKKIFADLKTMDTGFFEAKHAFRAGADYVSVLGVASDETVRGALKAAGKKEVVVDLVGCRDVAKRIRELKRVGARNFEVHTAIDEQARGKGPLGELKKASKIRGIRIWVAGGISLGSLEGVMKHRPDVVVVGGAITKAKRPAEAAKKIRERIGGVE